MSVPYLPHPHRATLVRVIDGDTIVAVVDLGCSVHAEITVRLDGVDTPELTDDDPVIVDRAERARLFTSDTIPRGTWAFYVLLTGKPGAFGRWAGLVQVGGRDLGSELVAAGLATRKKGAR